MAVVDTTALVALFDSGQPRRSDVVARLASEPVVHVPSVVLSETLLVLRKLAKDAGHDGNQFARACLADLLSRPGIQEEQAYDAPAARVLFSARPTLSYVDAVAIVVSRHLAATLVTLDKAQEKAWKATS